ncbi:MAG: glycosyltransferase family 2 protein, partial [Planctomycetota bacterium]
MPPRISASIICYNEQDHISQCIESLLWCDEIIVVDSGSTDKTCAIVGSYPKCRLLHRTFDTFLDQKNYAVDACSNDWILSLDADEIIPKSLKHEIQSLS